jgi:nucleotide-binding universal stress UspA family protein
MKKIIAAFDGLRFSEATMRYAIDLTLHTNATLVGVFLDDLTHHSYRFADVIAESGGVSDSLIQELNDKEEEVRDLSVEKFKAACQNEKVKYGVHRDRNVAIQELLHESIYSDLLIIENKESFNPYDKKMPATFMQDLLEDVQCPVLVVPEHYRPVEKIVLLYDGEPSSVYAAKMFSYLLPSLKSLRIEVLTITNIKENLRIPDKRLIREFTKAHYPLADYVIFKGNAEVEIMHYLRQQKESLLAVLGAYKRGRVSRWFKHSMADSLMANVPVPLFIAHNK